jgi:ribose transport system substrate-binding protein
MTRLTLLLVAAMSLLAVEPALAAKKQVALVLGGLDNPFFQSVADGCAKWTADHPDSDYECVATGPKSSSKPADELKLIEDAIAGGAVAIGVAPATDGIPKLLKDKAVTIPVITVAGDFQGDDQELRKSWVTADDYQVGVELAKLAQKFRPTGGVICREQNFPKALDINMRASGLLDTLSGKTGTTTLAGDNGWTEAEGCPLFNNNDMATADKQLAKVLAANPKLNTMILVGGWAMFDAKAYAKAIGKVTKRLASGDLVILSGDALPMQLDELKAGQVQGLVAPLPFRIGEAAADTMAKLASGETVPAKLAASLGICTVDTASTCTAH